MRLFLLFLLFSVSARAQFTLGDQTHDFGDLNAYSPRFVDFEFKNTGIKKHYVLRVDCPDEVVYLRSKDLAMPDSTVIVRLQANPKKAGKFSYKILIHLSDRLTPLEYVISGNQVEKPANDNAYFQQCPDFSKSPTSNSNFKIKITVVEKSTGKKLPNSTVVILQNGVAQRGELTDKSGSIIKKGSTGYFYFYGKHPGFLATEMGAMLNPERNEVTLLLEKDPSFIPEKPIEIAVIPDKPKPIDPIITAPKPIDPIPIIVDTLIPEILLPETPIVNFDLRTNKPISVTFILDVSGSMSQGDRLELMKFSLNNLVDMLRPCDKISIVTYSDEAKLMLAPTSGADKELIKSKVAKLKSGGATAGGSGIRLGYAQASKGKIKEGVNHVIIITDGGFNRASGNYLNTIKKQKNKGFTFSVVGIKHTQSVEDQLIEASEQGGGNFIRINSIIDASSNLNAEIQRLTQK